MAVIEFQNVSKAYQLGSSRGSLREAISGLTKNLFKGRGSSNQELFWALRDVNFKINTGDVVGFIGHNGAGKSTTLKLLSRVTYPTSGQVLTKGRIAALIELGAGFHPDLSGRDNIYLNGSIMGLKRREIDSQFSEIVEFAGLERFIDTPVKRYSSGMYVRLAFAVAAHVKADLLLVDEVLSVGDARFQQKSMDRMKQLRDSGATIVFVSHNLLAIQSFCSRAILLSGGKLVADGITKDVIKVYKELEEQSKLQAGQKALSANGRSEHIVNEDNAPLEITQIELFDQTGEQSDAFQSDGVLGIRVKFVARKRLGAPRVVLQIFRASDGLTCCETIQKFDPSELQVSPAGDENTFEVRVMPLQLNADAYYSFVYLIDDDNVENHCSSPQAFFFVTSGTNESSGIFYPHVEWKIAALANEHA